MSNLFKKSTFDQLFVARTGSRRELLLLNVLAIAIGVLSGYAALGFRYLIGSFQNLLFHQNLDFHLASPLNHSLGAWVIILPPIGLLISAYLIRNFAAEAKGHGVPEVLEAVMSKGGIIRKRIVAIKALASSITIATGGSVGREGPIVQIGAATGSAFGQMMKIKSSTIMILVGCGAAGAITATFNTPIAGVIFAFELVLRELKIKSFIPLVVTSVFATIVTRIHLGEHLAFEIPSYSMQSPYELLSYLVLGCLCGVVGMLFIKVLYRIEDFGDNVKIPFWSKPLLGGLLVGCIGYLFPEVFGVGYESILSVLKGEVNFSIMASLIFLKIICTSVTLGFGGSGGVFAPSLFIGAMLGGAFGWLANNYFPGHSENLGAYALVGMAALYSATGRVTFTSIVILMEMTGNYGLVLPLMFTCVVSTEVSWSLSKHSIYSLKLARKGLNLITDIGVSYLQKAKVSDVMTKNPVTLSEQMTMTEAHERVVKYPHNSYPVVDKNNKLTGVANARDIEKVFHDPDNSYLIKDIEFPSPVTVSPDEPVQSALKRTRSNKYTRILVVDDKTKKLVGIVSPTDLLRAVSKQED